MIIASDTSKSKSSSASSWLFMAALLVMASVIFIVGNKSLWSKLMSNNSASPFSIQSDLEQTNGPSNFLNDQISGVELLTSEDARSGVQSVKLDGAHRYGLNIRITSPTPGHQYLAEVWTKSKGTDKGILVVSGENSDDFYQTTDLPVQRDAQGWGHLRMIFNIPNINLQHVTVYVHVPAQSAEVFFDDIQVSRLESIVPDIPESIGQAIQLNLSTKALARLDKVKKRAQQQGLLITQEDDWVKGTIRDRDKSIDIKLRYKGDWLDHLQSQKSSFRIKVKDPYNWKGLITFSVQNPKTRHHLHEWVYHRFLQHEDILTPRYDFIQLRLNHQPLGLYAYEEHFDKQIIEHNSRREGPILKFTEDLFWQGFKNEMTLISDGHVGRLAIDDFWRSDIKPFKEGRTVASENLRRAYEIGQSLLQQWKYGKLSASEVFDVKRLAKYYAITDINQAYHGIRWHNQRFYYNPVISKLEPIGFDGFGEKIDPLGRGPFIGYFNGDDNEDNLYDRLFLNADFVRFYNSYLTKFTDVSYIEDFYSTIEDDLLDRLSQIHVEFPDYTYNRDLLLDRSKLIQLYLVPQAGESVPARIYTKKEDKNIIHCLNQHFLGVDIIGYSASNEGTIFPLDQTIFSPPRSSQSYPEPIYVDVPLQARYIVYKVAGIDRAYYSSISTLPIAQQSTPRLELLKQKDPTATFDFIRKEGENYVIETGEHVISDDLILPLNTNLIIQSATKIDVINGAKIIVNGQVIASGSEDQPITFNSSDRSAQGFSVLQSRKKSIMRHVHFKNFNTLAYNGWNLTGAVTFYESDVDISDCSITHNLCEDALNTIRCDVAVNRLFISDTYSDGFDADFCTGKIKDVRFLRTGNDGIDFSGSKLHIEYCQITSAGDKGISIGEQANVTINKAEIDQAIIGVASKDQSILTIQNIALKNCGQGFAVYQKKPEYGPANMTVRYYTLKDVKQPYLIDRGSRLILKNKEIIGE